MTDAHLYGWTIYANARDYPGRIVVRRWRAAAGLVEQDRSPWLVCDSLEHARASIPMGKVCMPRAAADDPVIVEVWI